MHYPYYVSNAIFVGLRFVHTIRIPDTELTGGPETTQVRLSSFLVQHHLEHLKIFLVSCRQFNSLHLEDHKQSLS